MPTCPEQTRHDRAAFLRTLRYDQHVVEQKTAGIYAHMLEQSAHVDGGNFDSLSHTDVELLFTLYDESFFQKRLERMLRHDDAWPMQFRVSGQMTRSGGKTIQRMHGPRHDHQPRRVTYEIAVSSWLLFQTFKEDHRPITVSGITCRDRLGALLRIMEHEVIHLAELLTWGQSSCGAPRFQRLAGGLFGHTAVTHGLITRAERARIEQGIRGGTRVWFDHDGRRFEGVVNRITKRATVLVPDDEGVLYSDGNRYLKFYVPLEILRRVES